MAIAPRFFETMGVALQRGREFSWSDDGDSTPVTIVSAGLAQRLFAGAKPLGRQVRIGPNIIVNAWKLSAWRATLGLRTCTTGSPCLRSCR